MNNHTPDNRATLLDIQRQIEQINQKLAAPQGGATLLGLIFAAISGAAAMYFFDPQKGDDRRGQIGKQVAEFKDTAEDTFEDSAQQLDKLRHRLMSEVSPPPKKNNTMTVLSISGAVLGTTVGAVMMYLFDPQWGARRRALLRDQLVKFSNRTTDGVEDKVQDLNNRRHGVIAEMRYQMSNEPVSDETLVARILSELGHVIARAGAVDVTAQNGMVVLRGNILTSDLDPVLKTVSRVPGVKSVNNLLQTYDTADSIPNLQGGTL